MTRGIKTTAKLKRAFRAAYLETASLSASARKVKLPTSTCMTFVRELEKDEGFVSARQALIDRAHLMAEHALIRAIDFGANKIDQLQDVDPASLQGGDPGPAYIRAVAQAHTTIMARVTFAGMRVARKVTRCKPPGR